MADLKCELYHDNFQNFKCYSIPKAQLVIADIPYNIGSDFYASRPDWYVDGDNKNGESSKARKAAFNTDFTFNIAEYFAFCNRLLKKEPKTGEKDAPCMIVFCAFQQIPEVGKIEIEDSQLVQGLQRTAPTGYSSEFLIQPAPVVAALFAVLQAVGFRHAPLHKRQPDIRAAVALVRDALRFIGGNADVFNHVVLLPQFPEVLLTRNVFQKIRTPPHPGTRPAKSGLALQGFLFALDRFVKHEVFKRVLALDSCDFDAGILLYFPDMVIELFKFQSSIAEQNNINLHTHFKHFQEHGCTVLTA